MVGPVLVGVTYDWSLNQQLRWGWFHHRRYIRKLLVSKYFPSRTDQNGEDNESVTKIFASP